MAEKHIEGHEVVYLSYPEDAYPGWKVGDSVGRTVTAPGGDVYHFQRDATVAGLVHNAGHRYDVQIHHPPAGDA